MSEKWRGYSGLEELGYKHKYSNKMVSYEKKALPKAHLVISLMKRWIMGTLQGSVSSQHLDYYLDEYTFRFNRRTSESRGKLFYRLVEQAAEIEPVMYKEIIEKKEHSFK